MNRILVIRGGAIGDFILTLPAIRALREAYPSARLELIGYKHIAALAESDYADAVRSIEYGALSGFFAKNGDFGRQSFVVAGQIQIIENAVGYYIDLSQFERLGKVVEGAATDRFDGGFN